MPIYKGSNLIKSIYKRYTTIDKVYKGSQLVYRNPGILPDGQVIYSYGVAGADSITITLSGYYKVELVGGGGGAYLYQDYDVPANDVLLGGSAGGYLSFTTWIKAGTYSATIGDAGTFGQGDIDGRDTAATNGGNTSFLGQVAYGGQGYSGTPRPSVNSLLGGGYGFNRQSLPEEIGYSNSESSAGGASNGKYYGTCSFSGASYDAGRGGGWVDGDPYVVSPFGGYIKISATSWNPPV